MVYWKIDDETIRCLINKEEISQMGFDLASLIRDADIMNDFVHSIVEESHKYVDWNSDKGIQKFMARPLPMDQFLLTISCTFREIEEPDINNMYKVLQTLKEKFFAGLTPPESSAEGVTTEQAENADTSLESSQESVDKTQAKEKKEDLFPPQKLVFQDMKSLLHFCSLFNARHHFISDLYRYKDQYILLVDFQPDDDKTTVISFMITAEEYGADCSPQVFDRYFLKEHGKQLIEQNALEVLISMA